MKLGSIALFVVLALAGFSACTSENERPGGANLGGSSWVLTSLAGDVLIGGAEATARFTDGQVSGSTGCNSYSGGYTQDGSAITVAENMVMTARGCEPAIMDQESAYVIALAAARRFSIVGAELTIETDAGYLTFTRAGS